MAEEKTTAPSLHNGSREIMERGTAGDQYTTFKSRDRRLLVVLLGYLGLASSLTANIYFPLLDLLAQRYGVSIQDINLTITLFFVFQGIAPSFWSPMSDSFGRRPVYLATFTVYTLASLGLSIVDGNYPALLLLRAMQSIGGSAVLSLAYAVVADLTVHSERGRFLGPMMATTNIGPCIGPVIGGGVVHASGDPRWYFRALLIFGASGLLLMGWSMPETARTVVGNGAVPAKSIWRTWWDLLFTDRAVTKSEWPCSTSHWGKINSTVEGVDAEVYMGKSGRGSSMIPNPFSSLCILLYPDTFLTLWLAAFPYTLWFCVQASIAPVFGG